MKVFSKVYCDRVYFLCAERFVTGWGFEPPTAPPTHLKVECPPPPPGLDPGRKGLRASLARGTYRPAKLKNPPPPMKIVEPPLI